MIPALNSVWQVTDFGDAVILSLLCVGMVFLILAIITLILMGINKIRALAEKETITLQDGTVADEDMIAAMLVASVDYRKSCKEDFKIASVKLIEQEKKGK